ncbi:ChaC-like protein [Rhizoclosmatium globosum]|uniref:glutathione-specific gamma-glutamylcyclotransferase n=1 Tax=Rhizoclosmatium globosum TaxID=329046 RepID=A0A1Y2CDP1_9FUNG|nr:ChaC-like protein [Rhizoclosmatium globosum]|eukprot:ORY45153.1 ChaC-like protein [Rhizoclosmatium globosum]
MSSETESGHWVFGYGSLIWKVDFPYERRVVGYIEGMHRRFWQGSHDHRGTATSPGRVVTLIDGNEFDSDWRNSDDTAADSNNSNGPEKCFGVAFLLRPSEFETVIEHLDFREKNGYHPQIVKVFDQNGDGLCSARVYVGSTSNVAFLGPVSADDLARHIVRAKGPSGRNIDYFLNVCAAVKVVSRNHPDNHLHCWKEKFARPLMNWVYK